MQAVAAEMNLSETAFVTPGGDTGSWGLRWFTPAVEVALCGHATLASAHVLWTEGVDAAGTLIFDTASGPLTCRTTDGRIEMDFPALVLEAADPGEAGDRLGVDASGAARTTDGWLIVEVSPDTVRSHRPDPADLTAAGGAVILTARGDRPGVDVVSRVFVPGAGVLEDPVTGSAHCALAPYWADRLGAALSCEQASDRGGTVGTELRGDRVLLRGRAVTVSRGELLAVPG